MRSSNFKLGLAAALAFLLAACQSTTKLSLANFKINEFNQVLSTEDQERWLNERWNYLRSFYQENEEPYFGQSTVDGNCEARSVDQVESIETSVYAMKSARIRTNEAGFLGICKSEEQTHRMRLVFLVCKSNARQFDLKMICAEEECRMPEKMNEKTPQKTPQRKLETLCRQKNGG